MSVFAQPASLSAIGRKKSVNQIRIFIKKLIKIEFLKYISWVLVTAHALLSMLLIYALPKTAKQSGGWVHDISLGGEVRPGPSYPDPV